MHIKYTDIMRRKAYYGEFWTWFWGTGFPHNTQYDNMECVITHYSSCHNILWAFGIPQLPAIYTIYSIYYGVCDLLGCAGNPWFHAIYCAPFIGASAYSHNAAIYCALFIMPGFIVASGNPQFHVILTIYCAYYVYCDIM